MHRLLKELLLNLATCLSFVYFCTIVFSENENRASMHICLLMHSGSCVREQRSNVSNSRKQHLFWIPASVETFKAARHSCAVRCMSSSSAPGVPAVPSMRNSLSCEVVNTPMIKGFRAVERAFLDKKTCYWGAGSVSVHFSGCSERSSGQPLPPHAHHTQASLARPTSGWLLLLPQIPSPLANWAWLLWVVLVGGGRHSSPSLELSSQGEFLRDWFVIIYPQRKQDHEWVHENYPLPNTAILKTAENKTLLLFQVEDMEKQV